MGTLGHFPAGTERPAASIARFTANLPEPASAAAILAHRFLHWWEVFCRDGFAPIRQAWLDRAVGLGTQMRARLPNETVYGIFRDLDPDGGLILETEAGSRTITSGEVFFAAPQG